MEYASEVWDGCDLDVSNSSEKKINSKLGVLWQDLPIFASRESIYYETGWKLLEDRRRFKRLDTFYSIHNQLCPEYILSELMPALNSHISAYNLRTRADHTSLQIN